MSFIDTPYDEVKEITAGELAFQNGYTKPLKLRIKVQDPYEDETLITYDSWDANRGQGVSLTDVGVTQGMTMAGDFVLSINDSRDRIVDDEKVNPGCIVTIEAGKTPTKMVEIAYGICYVKEMERMKTRYRQFTLEGLGWGSLLSYTHVNFQRIAPPVKVTSRNQLLNFEKLYNLDDVKHIAHQVVTDLFEDPLLMPFGGLSLKDRGHFDLSGISKLVTDFLPTINYPIVVAAEVLKSIQAMTGTIANIEGHNRVKFMHPNSMISGHTIRSDFDENDLGLGEWTSYSDGEWSYRNSILPGDNFANRLIARAEKIDDMTGSVYATAATSLFNKDIAQRLPPTTVLSNLSMVLSKTGGGTDEDDPLRAYLYGAIVEDDDFRPTGPLIARFRIPIRDIKVGTPTPVPKIKYVFESGVSSFNPSRHHWFMLFERGSGDSDAGDEDNTIYVWNNGDKETDNQYSAIRPLPFGRSDGDPLSNVGWVVQKKGPTYSFGFATRKTILCQMTHPASIAKWTPGRPIERFVPSLAGASIRTMMIYLSHMLQTSARMRRTFGYNQVSTPNKLFKIGSFVAIRDENSPELKKSQGAYGQLQEIVYTASVGNDDLRGNHFCNVAPRQYVKPTQQLVTSIRH